MESTLEFVKEAAVRFRSEASKLTQAATILESLSGLNGSAPKSQPGGKTITRRKLSAAAIQRIKIAQKARWAKWHAEQDALARMALKATKKKKG